LVARDHDRERVDSWRTGSARVDDSKTQIVSRNLSTSGLFEFVDSRASNSCD